MIDASFDPRKTNAASVSGAVQYDTGQRLRLRGLPTPEELAEMDDFLDGDVVSVQVQYAYEGDSNTESRSAAYSEMDGVWMVDVPDVYLQKNYPVGFFVYVGYGATEEGQRNKTMYVGAFTPKGRPAPNDKVTPNQINAWDALVSEVNLALASINTATSNANAAASKANTSSENADVSAANAQSAADAVGNATVSATTLAAGSAATVSLTEKNGVKHFTFGIPRGATGATGPAGVTFKLSGTTLAITTTS